MDERGEKVHGEVSSADASAGVAFAFVSSMRPATARVIAAGEILVVTDLSMTVGAALTVAVTNGNADAAGSRIVRGAFAANAHLEKQFATGIECPRGNTPLVKASAAGQVDAQIEGYILRA